MATVNLRSFRQIVRHNKRKVKGFLTRLGSNPPRGLENLKIEADKEAWKHTDCLDCANCCKTMSPNVYQRGRETHCLPSGHDRQSLS